MNSLFLSASSLGIILMIGVDPLGVRKSSNKDIGQLAT
jgi:hypothetical protein